MVPISEIPNELVRACSAPSGRWQRQIGRGRPSAAMFTAPTDSTSLFHEIEQRMAVARAYDDWKAQRPWRWLLPGWRSQLFDHFKHEILPQYGFVTDG